MGCSGSKLSNIEVQDLNPMQLFDSKGDPTSRCNVMLKEANDFNAKLKQAEKDLKALSKAAEVALERSKVTLEAPLPNVYEDNNAAAAAAGAARTLVGGAGYSGEQLGKIKVELVQALISDVFSQLDAYLARHTDAVAKQKVVNSAWADAESWRKKVEASRAKVQSLQARAGTDPKAAQQLDEAQKQLQVQESKLTIANGKHEEEEAAQFGRLSALNREAVSVRGLIRTVLGKLGESMVAARDSVASVSPAELAVPPPAAPAAAAPTPAAAAAPVAAVPEAGNAYPAPIPAPESPAPAPEQAAPQPSAPPMADAPPTSGAGYPTINP